VTTAVSALIPGKTADYAGIKAQRLQQMKSWAEVHSQVRAEDGTMAQWIRENQPQIWIHHHHHMTDFRAPHYDVTAAENVGIAPLPSLVEALRDVKSRGVIYSGTFFEPGEDSPVGRAPTPYALSKRAVWDELNRLCGDGGLRLSKVIIPNPVGPFENEDRLIPMMISHARASRPFHIKAPDTENNNISCLQLAESYVALADELYLGRAGFLGRTIRPQGWKGPTARWANIVNDGLIKHHMKLPPCILEYATPPAENPKYSLTDVTAWDSFWLFYNQAVHQVPGTF
jgi:hypothetical protein